MENFLYRLDQTIARTKRRQNSDGALLLFSLAAESEGEDLRSALGGLTRLEDDFYLLPDHRLAVILEDQKHVSDPLRVARRLQAEAGTKVEATAIAWQLSRHESAEQLSQKALEVLTTTKKGSTSFLEVEEYAEAHDRLNLEEELAQGIEQGEVTAYFQPIYDLSCGLLTGFEALVRWEHPTRGLMLPSDFLDIARARGHLLKIDEIVLLQSLKQIPLWNPEGGRPIYVSANLATDHFIDSSQLKTLAETLKSHPAHLERLRIDVCEQVLFQERGIESLKELDSLKIGFNLDDFGVNSASFHCLGSFPFHSLKIDRNLVEQMEDEVNAELIVAVLRIAKRMGMRTIAEGVVTHAQLEELRNLGCDEAQGFLFSEAVTVGQAADLIAVEYRW